ncbi:MAG TPA: type II toxin-antitoxin system HigB family toxin [Beijerinckiaceae bacterium]
MRIVARGNLVSFWEQHPETRASLSRWAMVAKGSSWGSTDEVQRAFPKARVLNAERVRFELAGGNYRMIVSFDFPRRIAFIKLLGTHTQYDAVDALTVSMF